MINPTDTSMVMFNLQNKNIEALTPTDKAKMNDEKLKKTAEDFESVFVNKLLETLDSTVERSEEFSGGRGEEMFRSMMYGEISKNIASNSHSSFGFAKQIYEQMKDRI
jgi:Rod binding domain-containing protein